MAQTRAEEEELRKKKELQPQVERFIQENQDVLDAEAISVLREMEAADQRRVLVVGRLRRCDDPASMLRSRARVARENEELYKKATTGEFSISNLVKPATEEEVDLFIGQNRQCLDELAIQDFRAMNGRDQARVIAEGPITECQDVASILQARAKHARELENQVLELMCKSQKQKTQSKKASKMPPDPELAAKYNESFVTAPLQEVPAEQRRFAAPALPGAPPPEPEVQKPVLVGNVKGVGGVIEVLKAKYGCQKGERLKVVGESGGMGGLWKLEGNKTIPKPQINQGWKWVLPAEPEAKKPKAKLPAAAAASPTEASPAASATGAGSAAADASPTGPKVSAAASKSRSRSRAGSAGSASSEEKAKAKAKAKSRSRSRGRTTGKAKAKDKDATSKRKSRSRSKRKSKTDGKGGGKRKSRSRSGRSSRSRARRRSGSGASRGRKGKAKKRSRSSSAGSGDSGRSRSRRKDKGRAKRRSDRSASRRSRSGKAGKSGRSPSRGRDRSRSRGGSRKRRR